jgi:hypothetical protein
MVGTPVVVMHIEAETTECICHKLPGCGGIEHPDIRCSEHGVKAVSSAFHTHAQQINRVNRGGRWIK